MPKCHSMGIAEQRWLKPLTGRAYLRGAPRRVRGAKCSERKGTLSTPAVSRAAHVAPPNPISKVRPDAEEILRLVLARLDDMKAEDTVTIDLTGKTSIADYMVVTSGRSNRHVGAVADRVLEDLAKAGVPDVRVEGMPHCDWVLIDAGDVIVHVFRPEVRAFYNLEKMWASARTARTRQRELTPLEAARSVRIVAHADRRRRRRPVEAGSRARACGALSQARGRRRPRRSD